MARERGRRSFSLDDEAHRLLDGVGNISEYVGKLVVQHGRDWTESLALLLEREWRPDELLAVCDALAGHSLQNAGRNGAVLAAALEQRDEAESFFAARGVAGVRRKRCLRLIVRDNAIAHAVATLAREYNLPNENCQRAVRGWRIHRAD